jgi:SAM-dependent methyltransferase
MTTVPELEERTIGGLHDFLAAEVASLSRSISALDVGCGSGAWLARLKSMGFERLWGIDAACAPAVEAITFVRADLDQGPPGLGRRFELITMMEVIEHLANPGLAVSFIADHLTPDGMALITSPNIHSLRCRLKLALTGELASFDGKGDPTHISALVLPAFRKVVERYGLRIEHCCTYPRRGSLVFGPAISAAAAVLRLLAADPLPGDTLCLRLRHKPLL